MKLQSWNVNGLRASVRKGFVETLSALSPDLIWLQETKLQEHQIPETVPPPGYRAWWSHAQRPGYSGVSLLAREELTLKVQEGIGIPRFDEEGRTLIAEWDQISALGAYFPNGGKGPERLAYKLDYYQAVLDWCQERMAEGRSVIVTGDLNTAHHPLDLARPKANRKTSGFMDIEREWLDRFEEIGLLDSFRHQHPEEGEHYSWWSQRGGARGRNVGWRLDYFWISRDLSDRVRSASLLPQIMGSDHCPVELILD